MAGMKIKITSWNAISIGMIIIAAVVVPSLVRTMLASPAEPVSSSVKIENKALAPAVATPVKLAVLDDSTEQTNELETKVASKESSALPRIEEVKAALRVSKELSTRAESILQDPRIDPSDEMGLAHVGHDLITPWRDDEEKFEALIAAISKKCIVLGSKGKRFDSRIPLANENLSLAQRWLWNSAIAASFGKRSLGAIYIKGVHAANDRAQRIIDGRFKIDPDAPFNAELEVPSYIDEADKQLP